MVGVALAAESGGGWGRKKGGGLSLKKIIRQKLAAIKGIFSGLKKGRGGGGGGWGKSEAKRS